METRSLKAALLDFDQTLVDLSVDWDRLRASISSLLAGYGVMQPLHAIHPGLEAAMTQLTERGFSPARRGAVRRQVNTLLTAAEAAAAPHATPLPGSREIIESLRAKGWRIIMQSSNSVRVIRDVLDRLGFPPVDAIVGRESSRFPKPNPAGVRHVLRQFGLIASDCVVIGDGDFDMELGRAIGAMTIRIGGGGSSTSADCTVTSLDEAARILTGNRQLQGAAI